MKRYIITCMAALMGVLYSQAESISVGDVVMNQGETTTVAINLTNSHTDLVSFQMDLYLPDGIAINKSDCSLSNRFESGQTLTIGKQADGAYRLTSTSFSLTPITGTSGTIISLSLTASNEIGAKSASIKNIMFATSNSERLSLNNISFGVTIRGEQSVSITSLPSLTYGDAYTLPSKTDQEQELTWTATNNDVATISGNMITTKGAGSTTVTATQAGTNIFYPFSKTFTLDVNKASLSAKVNDATKVYGSVNPSFSIEYNGLKNGETVPAWTTQPTIQTEATQTSGVGQYAIKVVNGVAQNYDLKVTDGTLSITPAALTIKANDATRLYNEDDPAFEFTCSGFVNNDDVQALTKLPDLTADATKTSNVGKYIITPSGAEAKNYTISYEQGELTITKRTLKATSNATRMYGEDNPLLSIEYDGFVNNETEAVLLKKPVGTSTATKTSNVGVYPITVSGGEATNYDFVYEQGTLTVEKASLSAKVNDATKVYGSANPSFSIEYNGLKNGETVPAWTTQPTIQTEATQTSGVGQYAIKAVNGVAQNYDLKVTDGTLSITPAALTINAKDATRLYYQDEPAFEFTCSGFVNGEDESVLTEKPTLSTSAKLTSNVGTYEIKVGETSSPNYSISKVNGTLTITPRTLLAFVGNYERKYNEDNPEFEVKYDGFAGNDDESVLSAKATASTKATKTSDVGTYPINVTGGSAENYTFNYTSGTLTINKAEQTISWQQNLTGLKVTDQVELKAEASSGLPITYTIDNGSSIADIYSTGDKIYIDCISAGEVQIIAVQPGNNNYYSTPRIRKNVIINDASNIRGDVNDDGVVNGTDIQAIINLIVESQYDEKGDVNKDDIVNGTDIQEVINIIVNAE